MSYYIDGKKGRDSFIQSGYNMEAYDFWLKPGESKEVVFVDDAAIGVMMASVQNGPDPKKDREQIVVNGEDSILNKKSTRVNIGYREHYTILDMTPYVSKKGEEKKYSKRILRAPRALAELLSAKRNVNGGDLTGLRFRVSRTGTKELSGGNVWDFVGKVDIKKLSATEKPLDYAKILKPKSEEYCERILNRSLIRPSGMDDFSVPNDAFAPVSNPVSIETFDPMAFVGTQTQSNEPQAPADFDSIPF